jgi:hypothetical protein
VAFNRITEQERELEVAGCYDTIVCGAGPAGFAAAVASARSGAKTMLIEWAGCLGGIWTTGNLSIILDGGGKDGIFRELISRLEQEGGYLATGYKQEFTHDSETMKLVLEQMCMEAGVEIQLHTKVVEAVVRDNEIQAIITEGHSGRRALCARTYIDATGNGELAFRAGCSTESGHPQSGKTQPASMLAIISGAPESQPNTSTPNMHQEFRFFLRSADIEPSYQSPCIFKLPNQAFSFFMINHQYAVRCDSTEDITKATIEGRKELFEAVKKLRKAPGWENAHLVSTSAHIGIREGRRVQGLYKLKAEDLVEGRRFDDAICEVQFQVDVHSLDKQAKIGYFDGGFTSKPYHIPFRSLVAEEIVNLGLAGRCVSGDFWAHASYRVTGNSVPMGEAIGHGAALAARNQCNLHEVNALEVSRYMREQGYRM